MEEWKNGVQKVGFKYVYSQELLDWMDRNYKEFRTKYDLANYLGISTSALFRALRKFKPEIEKYFLENKDTLLVRDPLRYVGKHIGHLTILQEYKTEQGKWRYKVKCDCGKEFTCSTLNDKKHLACRSCAMKMTFQEKPHIARKKYNIYEEKDDYILINKKVKIDKEDLELVKSYNRYVSINSGGYALMWLNDRELFLHRLILGLPQAYNPDDMLIGEHINGDRLDCRRANLRICKKSENPINCKKYKNNSSGHKGVYWHKKNKKWTASIFYNNQRLYLGSFDNYEDAVKVREDAELKYFKEYRRDKQYE